jgi:carotenoid cleavage dioxygenase
MGAFDDGKKVFVDVEMSQSNPFPFMPMHNPGERWDPVRGGSIITRLSAELSKKTPKDYGMEVLFPGVLLPLPRQDDRYNTAHYRYGFGSIEWQDGGRKTGIGRFDQQTRSLVKWQAPQGAQLAEICHAPKSATAPEGAGWVMAVATYAAENNRADLVILDAERVAEGPVATVKLPTRIAGQVHGWWVPGSYLDQAKRKA